MICDTCQVVLIDSDLILVWSAFFMRRGGGGGGFSAFSLCQKKLELEGIVTFRIFCDSTCCICLSIQILVMGYLYKLNKNFFWNTLFFCNLTLRSNTIWSVFIHIQDIQIYWFVFITTEIYVGFQYKREPLSFRIL